MKYKLIPHKSGLFQLVALKNFADVKAGDLGGFVESEKNLSQDGTCWVYGDARVFGNCWVSGSAQVSGDARVSGNAHVSENATVCGSARVFGNVRVCGNCWVFGNARVYGNTEVYGAANVSENARVSGNAQVYGNVQMYGNARVSGNAKVSGSMHIQWNLTKTPVSVGLSDGYQMTLDSENGKISAGCRYFTFEEAKAHWMKTRRNTTLGEERLDAVDFLEYTYNHKKLQLASRHFT